MDSLKITGEKSLLVRRLALRNTLKPAHLISSSFQDKQRAQNLNNSQEADEEDLLFAEGQSNSAGGMAGTGASNHDGNVANSNDLSLALGPSGGLDAQNVNLKLIQLTEQLSNCSNMCQIVDSSEYSALSAEAWHVYVVSEAYNSCLLDLYTIKKNENVDFTEEQLIEVSF